MTSSSTPFSRPETFCYTFCVFFTDLQSNKIWVRNIKALHVEIHTWSVNIGNHQHLPSLCTSWKKSSSDAVNLRQSLANAGNRLPPFAGDCRQFYHHLCLDSCWRLPTSVRDCPHLPETAGICLIFASVCRRIEASAGDYRHLPETNDICRWKNRYTTYNKNDKFEIVWRIWFPLWSHGLSISTGLSKQHPNAPFPSFSNNFYSTMNRKIRVSCKAGRQ